MGGSRSGCGGGGNNISRNNRCPSSAVYHWQLDFYEAPREEFADRSGDLAGVVHDLGIELLDFEHDLSLAITENRDNASDNYWTVSLRNEYRALSGEVFDHQSSLAALRSQALKARIAMDSDNRNYGQAQMGDALERAPDLLEPLPELFDRIESLFDRSRGLGPNFRLRERLARARVLVNEVTESIG